MLRPYHIHHPLYERLAGVSVELAGASGVLAVLLIGSLPVLGLIERLATAIPFALRRAAPKLIMYGRMCTTNLGGYGTE